MDPLKRLPRSLKQDLPCQMGSPISKRSVRSHATGSCRFWLKSSCGSKESSCEQAIKLTSREKQSLLFWRFADPPGLDGWLDQLFQVLKTLRNKPTISPNARSVASGSKRGPSSRVKACSAEYRSVL